MATTYPIAVIFWDGMKLLGVAYLAALILIVVLIVVGEKAAERVRKFLRRRRPVQRTEPTEEL